MLLTLSSSKVEAKVSAYHYISIPLQVYNDLVAFVDHYDTEVSGCGLVERIEHRFKSTEKDEADTVEIEFAIREVYLPSKQDNSGASTNIDDKVIADLLNSLLKQGKNTEHLRLHWHSHADMDTFHSGTDEDNYATLSNGDFLVSLVMNKAHKILGRVDYFKPVRVTLSELGVHLALEVEEKASPQAENSIKELDKYVAGRATSLGFVDTNNANWQNMYKDGELWGNRTLSDFETDMEVAKAMGISRDAAIHYRSCLQKACHCCPVVDACQEYLLNIDKLGYSY